LVKLLHRIADLFDDVGPPTTAIAGWHKPLGTEIDMGDITVVVGKTLKATVQFLDADGNPTTTDAPPQWSSNDTAVATVVGAEEDPNTATVTTVGMGSAVIECLAIEQDPQVEVRATGIVNVAPGDETPDAVVGEVTFEEEEGPPHATQLPA
jgi:hypothetical protein